MESKEISWKFVTTDELLSHGPCELICACLVVSAASTDSYLYNGENDNGDMIIALEAAAATIASFSPKEPVYCRRGLYVDVGTNVTGVFVQWRELGHTERGD